MECRKDSRAFWLFSGGGSGNTALSPPGTGGDKRPASKVLGSHCIGRTGETDIIDFSILLDLSRRFRMTIIPTSPKMRMRPRMPPTTPPTIVPVGVLAERDDAGDLSAAVSFSSNIKRDQKDTLTLNSLAGCHQRLQLNP